MKQPFAILALVTVAALVGCGRPAEEEGGPQTGNEVSDMADWSSAGRAAIERGAAFLMAQRNAEGKWQFSAERGADVGISALASWSLLASRGDAVRDDIRPVLEWLRSNQKEDGAVYQDAYATYCTSMTVMALLEDGDASHRPTLEKALQFVRRIQADETGGHEESSEDYGGFGYGPGDPPAREANLSTTQFALEAARRGGVDDQQFYSRALRFLERSQNRSESNPTRTAAKFEGQDVEVVSGNDGGAIYRPSQSKAGLARLEDGRVIHRSYGSMTYALLKSYLFCGLDSRDPRVEAAFAWMADNWQLDYNPGMEFGEEPSLRYQGLFYYYLAIARCLSACEEQKVSIPAKLANWREDLARKVLSLQQEDGSWANTNGRWRESMPALATAYSLLVLQECMKGQG